MKERRYRTLLQEMCLLQNFADDYHVCVTRQMQDLSDKLATLQMDANTQHAFIENRLAEIDVQLDAIRRQLTPTEPVLVGGCPRCGCPVTDNCADLRTYEIMPDGTRRECEE